MHPRICVEVSHDAVGAKKVTRAYHKRCASVNDEPINRTLLGKAKT